MTVTTPTDSHSHTDPVIPQLKSKISWKKLKFLEFMANWQFPDIWIIVNESVTFDSLLGL